MRKYLLAAVLAVAFLAEAASAQVICVKGNSIVTAKKCTKGAVRLTRSNLASLLGVQSAGLVNLKSCVREVVANDSCASGDVCATELVCGGPGTSAGSALNDYMIGWDWTNDYQSAPTTGLSGAYLTESGFYFASGSSYPTGIWIKTTSEDDNGPHSPALSIICCVPH